LTLLERLARDKCSILFGLLIGDEEKSFIKFPLGRRKEKEVSGKN
jgi:hypothetical protein